MYYSGDWAWWGWIPMTVMMIVFWGLVVWAVVTLARGSRERDGGAGGARRAEAGPEQILEERLARGEIDVREYEERVRAIRGGRHEVPG